MQGYASEIWQKTWTSHNIICSISASIITERLATPNKMYYVVKQWVCRNNDRTGRSWGSNLAHCFAIGLTQMRLIIWEKNKIMNLSIRTITLCLAKERGSNIYLFGWFFRAEMNLYKVLAVFIWPAFLCHPVACTFLKGLYRSLFPDVSFLRKCHKSLLEQETLLAFTHTVLQIWIWFCFASLVAHTQPLAHVPVLGSSRHTVPAHCTKNILMALAKGCFWLPSKLGDSAEPLHSEEWRMLERTIFLS